MQRHIGQFEADLIVTLAGRAVTDRLGAFIGRNFNLAPRNQGTGDRGAQQVATFIDRIPAQHWEHMVLDEHLAEILHVDFLHAQGLRLLFDGLQIFALPQVGTKRDDFAAIDLFQPLQNHRRVQAPRIGQYHFFVR